MRKLGPRKIAYIIIAAIAVMIAFSSCMTPSKVAKICKTCPPIESVKTVTVTVKDTSWKTESVKTNTIYLSVPGPTLYMPNPCSLLCDSAGKLKPGFSFSSTHNGITGTVHSDAENNQLVVKCNTDSLQKIIEEKTIEINRLRTETTNSETTNTVVKNELTGWQHFWVKSGYIFWIFIIIFVGHKVFKFYKKIA